MKAIPKYQKLYVYYDLIYEMNRYYLEKRKVKYVNDGARSITNHSNIQLFLISSNSVRLIVGLKLHTNSGWAWLYVSLSVPQNDLPASGEGYA